MVPQNSLNSARTRRSPGLDPGIRVPTTHLGVRQDEANASGWLGGPCPPASVRRVHQHLSHCRPGTGIRIHSVNKRSRPPSAQRRGGQTPTSCFGPPSQPRARNPRRYVDEHSALSVVARGQCASHPFLRSIRLVLAELRLLEFRGGSYIDFGRRGDGPHSRGWEALSPQDIRPEASAHADHSNERNQRVHLGPEGCPPKRTALRR